MREEAGSKIYIMKGYDGALSIYKASTFEKFLEDSQNLPFNKRNSRAYLRIQFGSACELDVDKQGRVQIPNQLLTKYNISKEVIILGVGDHIEVWNRETYLKYEQEADDAFEDIAEELGDEQ